MKTRNFFFLIVIGTIGLAIFSWLTYSNRTDWTINDFLNFKNINFKNTRPEPEDTISSTTANKLKRDDHATKNQLTPTIIKNSTVYPPALYPVVPSKWHYSKIFDQYGHRQPKCQELRTGNSKEIQFVKNVLAQANNRTFLNDLVLKELTDACHSKIYDTYAKLIPKKQLEEQEYPVAFAINVNEGGEHIEQLLHRIYRPYNYYCLKLPNQFSKPFLQAMINIENCLKNVFVVRESNVANDEHKKITTDLECMRTLKRFKWKYYISIEDSDYPLVTNLKLVHYLKSLNGHNAINSRVSKEIGSKESKSANIETLKQATGGKLYTGNNIIIATLSFCNYALESPVTDNLRRYLNGIHKSEEYFWATLQRVSDAPGGYGHKDFSKTYEYNIRLIKRRTDNVPCHGSWNIHNICTYGVGDLKWIYDKKHSGFLFASTFNIKLDHVILDCIESFRRLYTN